VKYIVTTWDGHTYFVDAHVCAAGFRAEFNGIARVAASEETAVTKLAAHCEWPIKNVSAASPVECFKNRALANVGALFDDPRMGTCGPEALIKLALKKIEETPA
jgi:hypothetical protein